MNIAPSVFSKFLLTAAAVLAFAPSAWADVPQAATEEAAHEATAESARHASPTNIKLTGFSRPESVLHDVKRDVYLVSNITNGPRDFDNTGFISRVSPSGQILDLKWIAGGVNGVTLNAPKGSTIANGTLYVADIDTLRKFDARTGRPLGNIVVPGATFLNDVASDRHGNVYVTDIGFTTVPVFGPSGTDAIHKLTPRDELSVFASGNSLLNHPNGIVVLPNGKLKVATYDPFNGTKELFTIDKRGFKSDVLTLPTGLLDGIVRLDHGFLVSSWVDFSNATAGVIYLVEHDGTVTEVASGFQNPSDIGFDHKRNRILIPELPDPGDGGQVIIRSLRRPRAPH
jgi:hypothetical protein